MRKRAVPVGWVFLACVRGLDLFDAMNKLTHYQKNGYLFEVIHRRDNIAIARESRHGSCEVFYVQSHNGMTIAGNQIPPAEYPPSNAQWGSLGWTRPSLESALQKMEELSS